MVHILETLGYTNCRGRTPQIPPTTTRHGDGCMYEYRRRYEVAAMFLPHNLPVVYTFKYSVQNEVAQHVAVRTYETTVTISKVGNHGVKCES